MSTYVTLDSGEPRDLCSNKGYGDFCRWVDSLPRPYATLTHLRTYGWEQDVGDLLNDIKTAASEHPPDDSDTTAVVTSLISTLEDNPSAEVVTISNGMTKSPSDSTSVENSLDEIAEEYGLTEAEKEVVRGRLS